MKKIFTIIPILLVLYANYKPSYDINKYILNITGELYDNKTLHKITKKNRDYYYC